LKTQFQVAKKWFGETGAETLNVTLWLG